MNSLAGDASQLLSAATHRLCNEIPDTVRPMCIARSRLYGSGTMVSREKVHLQGYVQWMSPSFLQITGGRFGTTQRLTDTAIAASSMTAGTVLSHAD